MNLASPPTSHGTDTERKVDLRLAAMLWVLPLTIFCSLIGKWSMSGDEYYTWFDSSKPIAELLSYERKPLYYLICHFLLDLDLGFSREVVIRIPAAIASSLIPPTFYVMLASRSSRVAVLVSVIALANPWLFQMSQFARFYSLAFLFTTIASLSAFRWLGQKKRLLWLLLSGISGLLAALAHTPAFIVVPASIVGLFAACFWESPDSVYQFLRRYGFSLAAMTIVVLAAMLIVLKEMVYFWFTSSSGQFGNYSVPQILAALAIFGGLSTWSMAILPTFRRPKLWTASDVFLMTTIVFSSVPLLALVPFGGGVAARYLMFCLPSVFVLAGIHWHTIHAGLSCRAQQAGLAFGLLAFNLPYLASVYVDGNHFDYREAARRVEAMELENPIIIATAHQLLNLYLTSHESTDLSDFENGLPRDLINAGIEQAINERRPLILVSREDRKQLSIPDQEWLYSRFAQVCVIEKPRFDHRRHRMVIYRYRPAAKQALLDVRQAFPMTSARSHHSSSAFPWLTNVAP